MNVRYLPIEVEVSPRDGALCAETDPEVFFPEKGESTKQAKRICGVCDVREACLEWAIAHDERFGVWGGLSERERREVRREQRRRDVAGFVAAIEVAA